jgi:hypothetical protein
VLRRLEARWRAPWRWSGVARSGSGSVAQRGIVLVVLERLGCGSGSSVRDGMRIVAGSSVLGGMRIVADSSVLSGMRVAAGSLVLS